MAQEKSSYALAGVDYEQLDPFKRDCQEAARRTEEGSFATELGIRCIDWTRGESAFAMKLPEGCAIHIAHVDEGLGTKNLVADAMAKLTGRHFYEVVAQDTVAMALNDLITIGATPVSMTMHLSVGSSDWFKDADRASALIKGWEQGCRLGRCVWAGGETATLRDIILPNACHLAGSALGVEEDGRLLNAQRIEDGDAIVIFNSNGIHANGLTLAREIALHLSKDKRKLDGYLTWLPPGGIYGEALLQPTYIYATVMDDIRQEFGHQVHYAVNITGHGWRKLMRGTINAEYIIEQIPVPQPVFGLIQAHNPRGPMTDKDMYGDFNMGAGFAIYIKPAYAERAISLAQERGFGGMLAGHVRRRPDGTSPRRVVIKPLDITFEAASLAVR